MATGDLTTEEGILSYLHRGIYAPSKNATKAERLPEGFGGFVYRVHLQGSEPPTIIVKHAEGYASRAPQWKLDTSRMVRTSSSPRVFEANMETAIRVQGHELPIAAGDAVRHFRPHA